MAATTVITREDIEQRQPQSVRDLLQTAPGISVARSGGLGTISEVFVRGADSDQVLVLIDGVRAASATTGQFDFQHLDPDQIERIEIVRGPRSTLYGSDAIGGVIQIFTRKNRGLTGSVEYGSYDTYGAQAGYGGSTDRWDYSINANYRESASFSVNNGEDGSDFDSDDDSYEEFSVTANTDAQITDQLSLGIAAFHSDSEVQLDIGGADSLDDRSDNRNSTVNLDLGVDALPGWQQEFNVGYAVDSRETEGDSESDITTRRITAGWQNNFALGEAHQLIAGVDYYRDEADAAFDETINNIGAYANLRLNFGSNDVELGGRYDSHSEFGDNVTGSIALGRELIDGLRVFASYSTAFQAPTSNELFFPGFGNPDLDPEESRTAELGLKFNSAGGAVGIDVNAFHTRIDDLIDAVFVGPGGGPFGFASRNVDETTINGLELALDWRIADLWEATTNATILNTENEETGEDLERRPEQSSTVGLTRLFADGGSVSAEWLLRA